MERDGKGALERAIEIARSGKAANYADVLQHLRSEGYGKSPLRAHGSQLRKRINELCESARQPAHTSRS